MAADGFITDLKRKFQQGDIVLRLVYVNVAVFLAVTLVQIFLTLFNVPFCMDELSGTAGMDGSFYP